MPDWSQRVLGCVLLVLVSPLIAALAIAVRLDSRGGPFFVAGRVGQGGRPFGLVKLRTMHQEAARTGPAISVAGDTRVTRIGRLLRGARLDELPQLWNVVRGEMRLVGPRPEDPRFIDLADPLHRAVIAARPGITGISQLLHVDEAGQLDRSAPETTYRTRIQPTKMALDEAYLKNRSIYLDAWILWRTALLAVGRPPSSGEVEERLGIHPLSMPTIRAP